MAELMWEGKYDQDGKRVGPTRVALPFQTVETVNESAQDRLRTLDLFARARRTAGQNAAQHQRSDIHDNKLPR